MALAGIVAGSAANDMNAEDPRKVADRRQLTWRTFTMGLVKSRRRDVRREDEGENVHSDWHHPWLFFLGVSIMLMSVADAFLTLQLLSKGAVEANPIMRGLLYLDTGVFVAIKLAMTGLAILVLVFASRYRLFGKIRVGLFIVFFFCLYLTLIFYELMGLIVLADIG